MARVKIVQKGITDMTGTNIITVFEPTTGMDALIDLVMAVVTIETLAASGMPRMLILSINVNGQEIDLQEIELTQTNGSVRKEILTQFYLPLDPLPLGQSDALHARVSEALDAASEVRFISTGVEGADV